MRVLCLGSLVSGGEGRKRADAGEGADEEGVADLFLKGRSRRRRVSSVLFLKVVLFLDRKEKEGPVRLLKERTRKELVQKKELLLLPLKRGGRGRRIKWSRETAICLRICSLGILQSSCRRGRLHAHVG